MSTTASKYTLADLAVVACAEAWRDDGEILASGIGVIPRLAAGLAMSTFNPDLMMTDGEAYLVSEAVPLGARGDYRMKVEGWMSYARVFDCLWGGFRHVMITPTQIDRFGQTNISCIGTDYQKPKVQLLGARGLPGNTANHANSMFVPDHTTRVFVSTEVDMVAGVGYNPKRFPKGAHMDYIDLRLIVSNLCVLDFSGPEHKVAIRSIHPGISVEQVCENTGFELHIPTDPQYTSAPTQAQMACIDALDPHNLRAKSFKHNTVFNS